MEATSLGKIIATCHVSISESKVTLPLIDKHLYQLYSITNAKSKQTGELFPGYLENISSYVVSFSNTEKILLIICTAQTGPTNKNTKVYQSDCGLDLGANSLLQ